MLEFLKSLENTSIPERYKKSERKSLNMLRSMHVKNTNLSRFVQKAIDNVIGAQGWKYE